jgi:hypothetical protein
VRRRRGGVHGDDVDLIETIWAIRERGRRIARSRGVVLNGQADWKIGDINSLIISAPGIDGVELQLRHRIPDLDVQGPYILLLVENRLMLRKESESGSAYNQKNGRGDKQFQQGEAAFPAIASHFFHGRTIVI